MKTPESDGRRAAENGSLSRMPLVLACALLGLIVIAFIYNELRREREPTPPPTPTIWTRRNELPLDLSPFFNNDGIASSSDPDDANFDCPDNPPDIPGSGYPAEKMPASGAVVRVDEIEASFLFPVIAPEEPNNVACSGQRIGDAGKPGWLDEAYRCKAVAFLGAAENGAAAGAVKLKYKDGSTDIEMLSFPDWCVPSDDATVAWRAPYRFAWDEWTDRNDRQEVPCYLYAVRIPVDPDRRLIAIRLPEQPRIHIFAITLQVKPADIDVARRGDTLARRYREVAELARQPRVDLSGPVTDLALRLDEAEESIPDRLQRQLLWLRTKHEYLTYRLDERPVLTGSKTEDWAREWIDGLRADLAELLAGGDPFEEKRGNILKGYVSQIDGQVQPYTVYVPESYDPRRPAPLAVRMHGHGWYRPFQGYPTEGVRDAVVLSPHGRGSMDYMFVGEEDVMAAIDEVQNYYTIDRRRVYLLGASMGGTGCWHLATRYPDRFAAIGPSAANTDSRAWAESATRVSPDTGRFAWLRRELRAASDPVTYAGNLLHTTTYFLHGADDGVVSVENSRAMARALEQAGCSFTYREGEGGHGWRPEDVVRRQHDAVFAARLVDRPRRVQLRASQLKHGRSHWLRILRFGRPELYGEVDAEVSGDSLIRVEPRNVTAFQIDLHQCPVNTAQAITVVIDDEPVFTEVVSDRRWLRFSREGAHWRPEFTQPRLHKRPYLEGPVSDAFTASFMLVIGTQSERAFDRRVLREEAERFADDWEHLYTKPPRVRFDYEVTRADIAAHNLVLYGGPEDNTITARINDHLPIRIENGAVVVGDRRVYRGEDVAAKFCYPNPLNPDRLAVVIAGANRADAVFQSNNLFGNFFQWGPYDNWSWFDYAVFDRRSRSAETMLEFGFFGHDWQLDHHTTWFGDARARERAPARVIPARTRPPSGRETVHLSELMPVLIDQHKMAVGFDTSAEGRELSVGPAGESRRVFQRGLGARAPSRVVFRIHRSDTPYGERFHRFRATVGIDLEGESEVTPGRDRREWVQFVVRGDGHLLYRTGRMRWDSEPVDIDLPILDVEELELEVRCTNARWLVGSAAWGDARIVRAKTGAGEPPDSASGLRASDEETGAGPTEPGEATSSPPPLPSSSPPPSDRPPGRSAGSRRGRR